MKRILALLALLFAFSAGASELPVAIGVHLYTYHTVGQWNNSNPGIYARWGNGLTIGTLTNSLKRQSNYVAYTVQDDSGHFELTMGAISGYDKIVDHGGDHVAYRCPNRQCQMVELKSIIAPLLVPSVRFNLTEHLAARVSILKAPGGPVAFHLSAEWKL